MMLEQVQREAARHRWRVKFLLGLPPRFLLGISGRIRPVRQKEFFAPLYVSSICGSDCAYCGFRRESGIQRFTLTEEEAVQEALYIKEQLGCISAYCLTGSFREGSVTQTGTMTEVNARGLRALCSAGLFPVLESSPFTTEENMRSLLEAAGGRGRMTLFMETYNAKRYAEIHGGDRYKGDMDQRLKQLELAIKAGWQQVGIGALLGLANDLIHELSMLIAHYHLLVRRVERITISVPRLKEATGATINKRISDDLFVSVVCILRLLCRQADLVLTGRESAIMRDQLVGVTDIWGVQGSTTPGGYTIRPPDEDGAFADGQFTLSSGSSDRRSISEILAAHRRMGIY